MVIQISSGQGPSECELAVSKLFHSLMTEFPDIELIKKQPGHKKDCCSSIIFTTDCDLSFLEGSVQWICTSPFRPHHKRKNWFVDISILDNYVTESSVANITMDDKSITFQTFHCGGHGGQNVNKVSTGVRLIHTPTGITVTSTAERSQFQNKQNALKKLNIILQADFNSSALQSINNAWREHNKLVRGNPVRIYEGNGFNKKFTP